MDGPRLQMLMRIAELSGEPDWIGLARAMPEAVFQGWCEHFERSPFGQEQWFEFFANAFLKLSWAWHDVKFAGRLEPKDFLLWKKQDRPINPGMTDDEITDVMLRWKALQKDGSV